MARLCCRQRDGHGLQVAHFTDQYDIRVLPQNMLQGRGEGMGIHIDLSLGESAFIILVQELHGVFDSDDVPFDLGIHIVEHSRQSSRFAAAGGPGQDHQTISS